jgi:hypothetical protein
MLRAGGQPKQQRRSRGCPGDDPAVSGINGAATRVGALPGSTLQTTSGAALRKSLAPRLTLAEVIPKASFPSVKFTYAFDFGDDWTHACEVLASNDPPDFSRAPANVCPSLSPSSAGERSPNQYGPLRDDDQP